MHISVSPLVETFGWRGQVFPAGSTSIPEDLAIALRLSPESAIADEDDQTRIDAAIDRLAELERIFDADGKRDWRAISEIGDRLNVTKHPDGWDASFMLIIEAEFGPEIAKAVEAVQ